MNPVHWSNPALSNLYLCLPLPLDKSQGTEGGEPQCARPPPAPEIRTSFVAASFSGTCIVYEDRHGHAALTRHVRPVANALSCSDIKKIHSPSRCTEQLITHTDTQRVCTQRHIQTHRCMQNDYIKDSGPLMHFLKRKTSIIISYIHRCRKMNN